MSKAEIPGWQGDRGGKAPPFIGLITVVVFLAACLIAQH